MKANQESQGGVNSLDSALLLSHPTVQKDDSNVSPVRAQTPTIQLSGPKPEPIQERARSATPSAGTFFRSATPTVAGFLAPPGQKQMEDKPGSIALRAIRSMCSLATMGSWAQRKSSSPPTEQEMAEDMRKAESEGERHKEKKKKDGTVKEKKKKDGTVKEKKKTKEDKDGSAREDPISTSAIRLPRMRGVRPPVLSTSMHQAQPILLLRLVQQVRSTQSHPLPRPTGFLSRTQAIRLWSYLPIGRHFVLCRSHPPILVSQPVHHSTAYSTAYNILRLASKSGRKYC